MPRRAGPLAVDPPPGPVNPPGLQASHPDQSRRFTQMIDLHFAEQIPTGVTKRLKRLDVWFEEYATDGLIGQELAPGPMGLRRSTQPTICMVEDIDSIDVQEATDL